MAAAETLEEGFESERAPDVLFHFGELPGGELFPARADGSIVAEAAEEKLDLREGEAHVAGEADEEDAINGVRGVTALAAEALGRGEEAHFFVVANGGGVEVGATGELADLHFCLLSGRQAALRIGTGLLAEKRRRATALQSARLGRRPLRIPRDA